MPREKGIQSRLLTALGARAGVWAKFPQDAVAGDGMPDIVGCYRGRYVAFEVKKPKTGKTSRIQRITMREILEAGGFAWTITSVDKALALLENIQWPKT